MRNRHVAPLATAAPALSLLGGGWPLVAVGAAAVAGEAVDDPRRARRWVEVLVLLVVTVAEVLVELAAWMRAKVPKTTRRERLVLGAAVGVHGLDVAGTVALVVVGPHVEAAPTALAVMQAGSSTLGAAGEALGLVGLKAAVLSTVAAVWAGWPRVGGLDPRPWRTVVPAVAAVRGAWLCWTHLSTAGVVA